MAQLLTAPEKNGVQKTLAAQLLSSAGNGDPVTFDDVDGIANTPGVLVIDRVDSNGTATPSKREFIEYSGTSGNTVIITTRNVDGSNSAVTHAVGAIVEFIPDTTWANRIYDALSTLVDPDDTDVINSSLVTLTGTQILTNKTLTAPGINRGTLASVSLVSPVISGKWKAQDVTDLGTVGTTETVNWANGSRQKMTLDENLTITFSNPSEGQTLTLYMLQDGSGTNTITFSDTIVWADNSTPDWTTTASKMNIAVITYVGSAYYGVGNKFA